MVNFNYKNMKKKSQSIVLLVCLLITSTFLNATPKVNVKLYAELADSKSGDISMSAFPMVKRSDMNIPIKYIGKTYNAVQDFNISNKGNVNTKQPLQKAIDKLSLQGGGTLIFPSGKYLMSSVIMKSNVHLKFSPNALLLCGETDSKSKKGLNMVMFFFGKDDELCENASIECTDNKKHFTVKVADKLWGFRFVTFQKAKHFLLSGLTVLDNYSVYSSVTFSSTDKTAKNVKNNFSGATDGVITDVSIYKGNFGYGNVQAQSAQNVRFYNLYGEGGVTLRLETGDKRMNNAQWGGVFDIKARNIMAVRAHSAFLLGCHSMHNGIVDASDITAISCGSAAQVGNGNVSIKYDQKAGLTPGTCEGGSLKNIVAYFGYKSQVKTKSLGYLPVELFNKVGIPDEKLVCYPCPSMIAVKFTAQFPYNFDAKSLTAIGFPKNMKPIWTNDPVVSKSQKREISKLLAKIEK